MNRPLDKDMIIDTKERILEAIQNGHTDSAKIFLEILTDLTISLYDIALRETLSNLNNSIGNLPGIMTMAKREISEKVTNSFKEKEQ